MLKQMRLQVADFYFKKKSIAFCQEKEILERNRRSPLKDNTTFILHSLHACGVYNILQMTHFVLCALHADSALAKLFC